MLRALFRAALAPLLATSVAAQVAPSLGSPQPSPLGQAGQNVTVSLLTMGNGDEVWEMFGHTAIWIHDNTTGRDTVLNWGVFDMRKPDFIVHFLQGLNLYQMGASNLVDLLAGYRYENRSVVSQELDLSTAQKDSLLHLIRVNAQPENLEYRYDYFRDNCATRPRDLLDRVLGGQLHAKANGLTGTTYPVAGAATHAGRQAARRRRGHRTRRAVGRRDHDVADDVSPAGAARLRRIAASDRQHRRAASVGARRARAVPIDA